MMGSHGDSALVDVAAMVIATSRGQANPPAGLPRGRGTGSLTAVLPGSFNSRASREKSRMLTVSGANGSLT